MADLPIHEPGGSSSHLSYELRRPEHATHRELCVVYCHGFASSRRSFKTEVFGRLLVTAGLAFCSFDFQGHGESGGTITDMTVTRNIEDLGRMVTHLQSLGFRKLIFFGSSMGGGVAAWYAARHPEQVVAAVYIAPGFNLEGGVRRRLGEETFQRWPELGRVRLHHELGSYDLDWRMIEDLRSYRVDELSAATTTQTLIFQGQNDTDVDWRMVLDFAVNCPAQCAQLHLMTDGDHRLIDRLPLMWRVTSAFLVEQGWMEEAAGAATWPMIATESELLEEGDHDRP